MDTEDGIAYRNAEEFLKMLPQIRLDSGLEKKRHKEIREDEPEENESQEEEQPEMSPVM